MAQESIKERKLSHDFELELEGEYRQSYERRVPLTVCPLSNVKLRVFDTIEDHNLKTLLDAGLRATVNSDDPAYFGGYIEENFRAVHEGLNLTRGDLHRLAANAIEASFLPEDTRRSLSQELSDYATPHV